MITGYFKEIFIPETPPGEMITATVDFYALNPGALYWKTFLIAHSYELNLKKVLDAAREIGQEGGRRKEYDLGVMPSGGANISFFIFAHEDAGYDWDWGEYDGWLEYGDLYSGLVHLASEYKFLTPGIPPPPPETKFSGLITGIKPTVLEYGQPLDLFVTFNAYSDGDIAWQTRVTAQMDSQVGSETAWQYGRDGSMVDQEIHVGIMPNKNVSGRVVLEAREGTLKPWIKLDEKAHTIAVTTEPPPVYTCPYCGATFATKAGLDAHIKSEHPEIPPPTEEEFPWLPIALIGGGVIVAVAALTKGKKKI